MRTIIMSLIVVSLAGCTFMRDSYRNQRPIDKRVAPLQEMADRTAQVYGKSGAAPIVYAERALPTNVAGQYRGNMIAINERLIGNPASFVVLAHELSHYVLGHWQLQSASRSAAQEREANAKAVEILTRLGLPEPDALRAMYLSLAAMAVSGEKMPMGHEPCSEIDDLLKRYPNHADDLTRC